MYSPIVCKRLILRDSLSIGYPSLLFQLDNNFFLVKHTSNYDYNPLNSWQDLNYEFIPLNRLQYFKVNLKYSSSGEGGGPRVVVSTAAFHARVRGSVPGLSGLKETKNVSSPSTCESQYCGEPPWPRGNVLGLRPPGLEFRTLCLEDSVISIISPSSGGSPGPV